MMMMMMMMMMMIIIIIIIVSKILHMQTMLTSHTSAVTTSL